MPAGYADCSGYARPYTGTEVLPAFGFTTRPGLAKASGAEAGLLNHASAPRYQTATQSPSRCATTYFEPAAARAPMSETTVVLSDPSGCKPRSLTSGAASSGA